uniref:Uncharacterized protein n=1 Tax=Parascaris univalens TaxID=6257 RepID=A0A915B5V9_PARUN
MPKRQIKTRNECLLKRNRINHQRSNKCKRFPIIHTHIGPIMGEHKKHVHVEPSDYSPCIFFSYYTTAFHCLLLILILSARRRSTRFQSAEIFKL